MVSGAHFERSALTLKEGLQKLIIKFLSLLGTMDLGKPCKRTISRIKSVVIEEVGVAKAEEVTIFYSSDRPLPE